MRGLLLISDHKQGARHVASHWAINREEKFYGIILYTSERGIIDCEFNWNGEIITACATYLSYFHVKVPDEQVEVVKKYEYIESYGGTENRKNRRNNTYDYDYTITDINVRRTYDKDLEPFFTLMIGALECFWDIQPEYKGVLTARISPDLKIHRPDRVSSFYIIPSNI